MCWSSRGAADVLMLMEGGMNELQIAKCQVIMHATIIDHRVPSYLTLY